MFISSFSIFWRKYTLLIFLTANCKADILVRHSSALFPYRKLSSRKFKNKLLTQTSIWTPDMYSRDQQSF